MAQEDINFELVPGLKLDHKLVDLSANEDSLKVPKRSASVSTPPSHIAVFRRPSAPLVAGSAKLPLSSGIYGSSGPSGPSSPAGQYLHRINSRLSGLSQSPPEVGVGVYKWGKVLGNGGSSLVREAIDATGRVCAVKIISKSTVSEEDIAHELAIWSNLRHPNILELLDHYETTKSVYLITECMTLGSLHDYLKKTKDFNPKPFGIYARYLRDLAAALRYMHVEQQVVHRDVKLENCLIHPERGVLLCDFGLAEPIGENILKFQPNHLIGPGPTSTLLYSQPPTRRGSLASPSGPNMSPGTVASNQSSVSRDSSLIFGASSRRASISTSQPGSQIGSVTSLASFGTLSRQNSMKDTISRVGGSLPYAAPELLDEAMLPDEVSVAVDIWAFGICLYTLFTSRLPWSYPFSPRLRSMILTTDYDESLIPVFAKPLVAKCLNREYQARPDICEVYNLIDDLVASLELEFRNELNPSYNLGGTQTPRRPSMDAGSEVLQSPLNVS